MKKLFWTGFVLFLFLALLSAQPVFAENNQENTVKFQPVREHVSMVRELPEFTKRFGFDSGYHFEYPDAVRGIYVTGHSAGGAKFHSLVNLIDNTDLNAMVIDIMSGPGVQHAA